MVSRDLLPQVIRASTVTMETADRDGIDPTDESTDADHAVGQQSETPVRAAEY